MTRCIFNDEWQELEQINIPIQSEAIQYGIGLFETLRTYSNKSVPFLDAHLTRLFGSIKALDITCRYSPEQISAMVKRLVTETDHELQRLKIVVIPEGVLVTTTELLIPETESFSLTSMPVRRSLAEHKSTSYLDCHLAWSRAQVSGYDDSILHDDCGEVYETGRGNLFWIKDGATFTRERHVLPGIMRGLVLAIERIQFADVNMTELMNVDEVFVTNSIRGIIPVTHLENKAFSSHEVTQAIQEKLRNHIALAIQDN